MEKKIIIVSDTHGNVKNFRKVVEFANKENIGIILHAGDIGDPDFLRESLNGYNGKFFGVLGNMDTDYKILLEEYNKIKNVKIQKDVFSNSAEYKNDFPDVKFCFAITHKPEDAHKLAESKKYDLVFYGHTHKPCLARRSLGEGGGRKECLLVNPGELAGQIFKPSFAIYDTEKDFLELKILEKI